MRLFLATFVCSTVAGMGIIAPTISKQLHEATLKQCYTHDWPAHQAEAHLKFCQEYVAANY